MCREKLPVWQKMFEKYGSEDFTIVGLALDAEGVAPAKIYYEKYGVRFASLVDPNYATQFGAVPKTFFVDEHGVVQNLKNWEQQLAAAGDTKTVTDSIRNQWSESASRFDSDKLRKLVEANSGKPQDLSLATQLASRYLALDLRTEARVVLQRAIEPYNVKKSAKTGGDSSRLLGQAYFQLMRSYEGDRESQVRHATTSYYLNPSVGFAKQIARIIDPDKFDHRASGRLDDTFREATYQRLRRERVRWLAE